MNTTKEIVDCYNKHKITHSDNDKWYSEEDIKRAIKECYSQGHDSTYFNGDDNLICVQEFLEKLIGD